MKICLYITLIITSSLTAFGQVGKLVWSDEFDSSALNTNNWNFEIGNGSGGWGNNEKEYYTNRPENIKVENGILTITALKEIYGGCSYTSARVQTRHKAYWKYGRIEMRAKLPKGKGTWPAFWMLPEQQLYGSNYWPDNGEIDIMEYVGYMPSIIHGTVHMHANYGGSSISNIITFYGVENDYHVYAIEWTPDNIKFYVDSYLYGNYERLGRGWANWPYDQNFFVLINMAIGGNWGGAQGIDTTIFPQTYQIDYVRVYEMNITGSDDIRHLQNKISAVPNPTCGRFKLNINENNLTIYNVSIYDAIGNQVAKPIIYKKGCSEIDIGYLNTGLYLVKVQDGNHNEILKIVKK